jgi:hypothetical protein
MVAPLVALVLAASGSPADRPAPAASAAAQPRPKPHRLAHERITVKLPLKIQTTLHRAAPRSSGRAPS